MCAEFTLSHHFSVEEMKLRAMKERFRVDLLAFQVSANGFFENTYLVE
jgi:hypothetical protein